MASNGVFVRVICVLKRSISCDWQTPSMILAYLKHRKRHRYRKMGPKSENYEERQRAEEKERQPRVFTVLIKLYRHQLRVNKRTAFKNAP